MNDAIFMDIAARLKALELIAERTATVEKPFPPTYGNINFKDNTTEMSIAVTDTYYQVVNFDTNGQSANTTPDHTNDHITINDTGVYLVICNLAIDSVAGAGALFVIEIQKNNGAAIADNGLQAERTLVGGGGEVGSAGISGLASLTAGDTIELWIKNATNTQNVVIDDSSLSVLRIA